MHTCWGGGKHWQSLHSITKPFSFCKSQSYIVYIMSLQHINLTSKQRSSMVFLVFLVWWHVVCVVCSEPRLCSGWVMNRPQIPQTQCTSGFELEVFTVALFCISCGLRSCALESNLISQITCNIGRGCNQPIWSDPLLSHLERMCCPSH